MKKFFSFMAVFLAALVLGSGNLKAQSGSEFEYYDLMNSTDNGVKIVTFHSFMNDLFETLDASKYDLTTIATSGNSNSAIKTDGTLKQGRWVDISGKVRGGASGNCRINSAYSFNVSSGNTDTLIFYVNKCDSIVLNFTGGDTRYLGIFSDQGDTLFVRQSGSNIEYLTSLTGTAFKTQPSVSCNRVVFTPQAPQKQAIYKVCRGSSSMWVGSLEFHYFTPMPLVSGFSVEANGGVKYEAEVSLSEELGNKIELLLPFNTPLNALPVTIGLAGTAGRFELTDNNENILYTGDASESNVVDFTASNGATPHLMFAIDGDDENIFTTYNVYVTTEASADTRNTIKSMTIDGAAVTLDNEAGTAVKKVALKYGSSNVPVSFELASTVATSSFTSGNSYDFANGPLTITVTAQDGSTKQYTVSAEIVNKLNIGVDWVVTDGVGARTNATSGYAVSTASTTYTLYPNSDIEMTLGLFNGGAINNSDNNVYENPSSKVKIPNFEVEKGALEGLLTTNSKAKVISGLKINGTANATDKGGEAVVLFSAAVPFDENAILDYDVLDFPACRAGVEAMSVTVPVEARSFRVYRHAILSGVEGGYKLESAMTEGATELGTTDVKIRIAYVEIEQALGGPIINKFTVEAHNTNYDATVNQIAKTISVELPFGTNITSVEPQVTIGGSATDYSPKGAQNFSAGAVTYSVTDGTNSINYATTMTVSAVADSVKTISSLKVNGQAAQINDNDTISITFPKSTGALANWPVEYELASTVSSANFVSGSNHNFANGNLTITVTAQDNSTKAYTIIAKIADKSMIAIAATSKNDYDSLLLKALNKHAVEYVILGDAAPEDGAEALFAPYEMVIMHSSMGGAKASTNSLKNLVGKKPMLGLKMYTYNTSARWGWSNAAANSAVGTETSYIMTNAKSHPIFNDVTFADNGNVLNYFKSIPTVGNAIQYASDFAMMDAKTASANRTIALASEGSTNVQMHEVCLSPAAKYLGLGFSNEGDSYSLWNSTLVKVIENAADYLLNPTANFFNVTIGKEDAKADYLNKISIVDNSAICAGQTINIVSIAGVRVAQGFETVSFAGLEAGIYIATANGAEAVKIVVE